MNDNFELIENIYTDAEMAIFTLNKTTKNLEKKENKIKEKIDEIKEGYQDYKDEALELLKENAIEPEEKGFMAKIGADIGIKKEVIHDNSDFSIAEMLIKGISMGILDMEKRIDIYKHGANKEVMKISYSFLKFQKDKIEELKKYL